MKKIIVSILIVFTLFLSSCAHVTGDPQDQEIIFYFHNNSRYVVNIEVASLVDTSELQQGNTAQRPIRQTWVKANNLQAGDTAEVLLTKLPAFGRVHNPLYGGLDERPAVSESGVPGEDGTMFRSGFGRLENLVAKITFESPEGNRCLVFEGDVPTTAEYPDIRLWSGYAFDAVPRNETFWPIYTIADSLFAKATVCE